jgi:hypothetical protein
MGYSPSFCGFQTMPISVPGHADHLFRDDPDRLITIVASEQEPDHDARNLPTSVGTGATHRCQISQMREKRRAGIAIAILLAALLVVHESHHFFRYGHLAPFGLLVDVTVGRSREILGIRGTTEIYQAQLTNYGAFPTTITVCDYLDSGICDTMINYVVERRRTSADTWVVVPECSEYGSRFFCRTSFEVTGTHLVRRRLRPAGHAMQFG